MPDKKISAYADIPDLRALCSLLGQIPAGQNPIPDPNIPLEWDAFSSMDWEHLITGAQAQGLAPLLYWVLSRSGKFTSLPEAMRNSLRMQYSLTWTNNQKILGELETLAQEFHQAGIPLMILKGTCLVLTIYPDIGLRPMGDLDVLVPGEKREEAVNLAQSLGYRDLKPEAFPGLRDLLDHEISLQKTGSPSITLDIHHNLVTGRSFLYSVPAEWFWEQIEPMKTPILKTGDNYLFILTPTAQLLYAAAHAMLQHGGINAPLRWFYDLDRLIRCYAKRLDWDVLLDQARTLKWGSAMRAALSKTVAFFGTPCPEDVLTQLAEISDQNQRLVALKQIRPTTHISQELQKFLSLKLSARIRLLLALIAPSPAYMRWRYKLKSSWSIPAAYAIRWWDILKDGFRLLISRATRTALI